MFSKKISHRDSDNSPEFFQFKQTSRNLFFLFFSLQISPFPRIIILPLLSLAKYIHLRSQQRFETRNFDSNKSLIFFPNHLSPLSPFISAKKKIPSKQNGLEFFFPPPRKFAPPSRTRSFLFSRIFFPPFPSLPGPVPPRFVPGRVLKFITSVAARVSRAKGYTRRFLKRGNVKMAVGKWCKGGEGSEHDMKFAPCSAHLRKLGFR